MQKGLKTIPLLPIMLIIAYSLSVLACGRESHSSRSSYVAAKKNKKSKSEDAQGEISLADLYAAIGLRSFDQVNETMAVVTGVSPTVPAITTVFAAVRTQLPANNDLKSFIASHQVGVSKLAIEYCDALVNTPALRDQVSGGFNFAAAPSQAFSASSTSKLIDGLINKFWGVDLENLPDRAEAEENLNNLVQELLAGENMSTVTVTTNTAKGLCTAVLSSASVMVF